MNKNNPPYTGQRRLAIPLSALPTCKQLGEQLIAFGDVPLFSGRTEWAITGFSFRTSDNQVATRATLVDFGNGNGDEQ